MHRYAGPIRSVVVTVLAFGLLVRGLAHSGSGTRCGYDRPCGSYQDTITEIEQFRQTDAYLEAMIDDR